jgi:hypothetical protein
MLRLRENLLKEITEVMLEQVKSRNMELVFDKSGASLNRFSPILFSPEAMDFTADVVAALNKRTSATTAIPPEKPGKP